MIIIQIRFHKNNAFGLGVGEKSTGKLGERVVLRGSLAAPLRFSAAAKIIHGDR